MNKPNLLKTIDISKSGMQSRMTLGDVDGDGRLEIVMMQPDKGFDTRYWPSSVNCITVYTIDGEMLWQTGTPDSDTPANGADIPLQIFDFDNDGYNEVIAVMNDEFCVFNGKDGTLKKKFPLPDQDAHDCIIFADFEGAGRPVNVILKDRYKRLWVCDNELNVKWTFEGNIGHYPYPYDINNDGRDELIAGYTVLDGNGNALWEIDMTDHADCIWVGDLDQNIENGVEIVVGGEDTTAYSCDGKLIWRYKGTVESQNVAMGNFLPHKKGTEVGGLDRIDRTPAAGKDGLFLVDYMGNELYKEDRKVPGWASIATMIHNYDGKKNDYLVAYRRGGNIMPALYNGNMEAVCEFPVDGHFMYADLLGDNIPQVIIFTEEKAYIYSNEAVDLTKPISNTPRPQPKRLYNWTRYWGDELPVNRYDINYVTGIFENSNLSYWAKKEDAGDNEELTRADLIILLNDIFKVKGYYKQNYKDVLKTKYYHQAVGLAKEKIFKTSDEIFHPENIADIHFYNQIIYDYIKFNPKKQHTTDALQLNTDTNLKKIHIKNLVNFLYN